MCVCVYIKLVSLGAPWVMPGRLSCVFGAVVCFFSVCCVPKVR